MEDTLSILLPNLPNDVVIDILSRLPVKILVRFSCVCKVWQKLVTSDRRFIRSQLQNSVKNLCGFKSLLLSGSERLGYCSTGTCQENQDFDRSLNQMVTLINGSENPAASQLIFREGKLKIAGCSDGIICFFKFCSYSCHSRVMVYLCNPALRQYRALPPGYYCGISYPWSTILCFLFDPVSDDYKVVKIIDMHRSEFLVEIYSLSNDSWKTFSVRNPSHSPHHLFRGPLVVHNGFPYWLVWNSVSAVLNVFDMVQEKIEEIPIPADAVECPLDIDLGVFQGSLSIFGTNSSSQNVVWVMKKDRLGISWMKQVIVLPPVRYIKPLSNVTTGVTASGKSLLVSDQGVVFHSDPEDQKVEDQNGVVLEHVHLNRYVVADYVASLASVIPPEILKQKFSKDGLYMQEEKQEENAEVKVPQGQVS
ncbi:F-box/kelch-repeat protein At3g23880-like [Coffea arabica]|uniref:F-box/kelch-repeat protein At3g23880-like n=1 Tax=Coffea arabica TaxID=13443 RepID=A0A6P6TB74_COFAR|nr:F-box/kelch-repeat protein At3g23880-like [Coffea arabica]